MKTELKTEYRCVKCKEQKQFHQFSIHYTGDWDAAFVKRICKVCDKGSGASAPEEVAKMKQELQRKLRDIARLDDKLSNMKLAAEELSAQLKCAKKDRISIPTDEETGLI